MKIKIGRYAVQITHPDKILFGTSGLTKKDLIDYYHAIAPIMMPHLNDRPISMQRFPQGITHEGFYQKDASDYFPQWITRAPIAKAEGDTVDYVVIDKPATLIYLANQNCITPHVWLSKTDNLNTPDRMIFDLDPAEKLTFTTIQDVAQKLKAILDDLQLPSFYMLTGSRGAHMIVPLKRVHTFDETRAFARDVATVLAQKFPKLVTIDVRKTKRGKRVFVDWLRNGFGTTAVAAYAVRAQENAPIAIPVTWKELLSPAMTSQKYTIKNAMKHINKGGDIWSDMNKYAVSLTKSRKKLDVLLHD